MAAKRAGALTELGCPKNTCGTEVWKDLVGHEGLKLRDFEEFRQPAGFSIQRWLPDDVQDPHEARLSFTAMVERCEAWGTGEVEGWALQVLQPVLAALPRPCSATCFRAKAATEGLQTPTAPRALRKRCGGAVAHGCGFFGVQERRSATKRAFTGPRSFECRGLRLSWRHCRAIEGRRCRCTTLASMGVTSTVTWHEVEALGCPWALRNDGVLVRHHVVFLCARDSDASFIFFYLLFLQNGPGLLRSSGCCAMQERQLGAWQLEKLSPLGTWQEPVPWRSGWSRNTSEQRLGFADSSA